MIVSADLPGVDPTSATPVLHKPEQKRAATRSPRRRAREHALQGLYEWLIARSEPGDIAAHVGEQVGFEKCDHAHFDLLLRGCIGHAAELDAVLAPHLDRQIDQLSPVEHGVLLIGGYELMRCADIPFRVAINEAVELAKSFGGTDGHKYVNGVLDKVAGKLRREETQTR